MYLIVVYGAPNFDAHDLPKKLQSAVEETPGLYQRKEQVCVTVAKHEANAGSTISVMIHGLGITSVPTGNVQRDLRNACARAVQEVFPERQVACWIVEMLTQAYVTVLEPKAATSVT